MKPYEETHQDGMISFEQDIKHGMIKGDFGIQIAKDGRIWICIDGHALIRFKPIEMTPEEKLLDLLTILHRDGGHYTAKYGIDKSIKDAKIKYLNAVHQEKEKVRDDKR